MESEFRYLEAGHFSAEALFDTLPLGAEVTDAFVQHVQQGDVAETAERLEIGADGVALGLVVYQLGQAVLQRQRIMNRRTLRVLSRANRIEKMETSPFPKPVQLIAKHNTCYPQYILNGSI